MEFVYTQKHVKTVYRPFGSIDFHASAGIPAFRVQRVKERERGREDAVGLLYEKGG